MNSNAAAAGGSSVERAKLRQEQVLGKPPRVAPLDKAEHGQDIVDSTSRLRDAVAGAQLPPIPLEYCPEMVATLLRYPELWERLAALSAIVQCASAKVPARERQLAILLTVWLCGAPYQWGEHLERTRKVGVTDEEIERVKEGSAAPGWGAQDRALLQAVEELHFDAFMTDETWDALRVRFDENQLFELIVLVGQFSTVACLLNSMRMRLEPNNKGFAG